MMRKGENETVRVVFEWKPQGKNLEGDLGKYELTWWNMYFVFYYKTFFKVHLQFGRTRII